MSVDGGAHAVAKDPKGFARFLRETWSPSNWFDDATFEMVAKSFDNPHWLAVTLSNYRGRWREEPGDPRYDGLYEEIARAERSNVPTLTIQGAEDGTGTQERK